jgi:hypothetical protein
MQLPIPDWRLVAAITLLMVSISVCADTRVVEAWTCTLNEGKSAEDLNAINDKYLAWANKQSYGGDIRASIAVPTVSDNLGEVLILCSYPDRVIYGADMDAFFGTAEGHALMAEYEAVVTCDSNAVYAVTESGSD